MDILKTLTSVYTKKLLNRTKRLNRARIKNICLSSNTLFQIPFSFEQIERYKGISCHPTYDCFFQVLTVLGLRHYCVSKKDSRRIYKESSKGVEVNDAGNHLSTIFGSKIETRYINPCSLPLKNKDVIIRLNGKQQETIFQSLISEMKLENGHATFICAVFSNNISNTQYGHFFISHKQNDILFYYDQSKKEHTTNIKKIFEFKRFIGFFAYYNRNNSTNCLIRDKLTHTIPIHTPSDYRDDS